MALKPTNLTFDEAAALPTGGIEAMHFLRRAGDLRAGGSDTVGAGGAIGSLAVQIAAHLGATVTGVDLPPKQDLLRSLRVNRAIDASRLDFTRMGETYDVIFDAIGATAFAPTLAVVRENGAYLLGNPTLGAKIHARWASATGRRRVIYGAAPHTASDLLELRRLVEGGGAPAGDRLDLSSRRGRRGPPVFESGAAVGRVVLRV